MAASIQDRFPNAQIELIPGGRGDFIVKAGERELWNKRAQGEGFPEHSHIVAKLEG